MPHNAIKCRLLQLYDRLVYKKTARRLREGAALRFPFYIRFADGSLPSGFLSAEIQPIQECCDLCAGAGGVGVETTAANTGGDAAFHGPGHGVCVVAVSGDVGEVRRTARRGLARGTPQHGDHLGAVDGGVGLRAVGDTLLLGPQLRLFVPSIAAVQICVVLPRQNRPKLGAGGGVVGGVDGIVHAVHQLAGADKVNGVLRPVISRVGEILRIINDFDRRAAVDRQLDAVLGGQGVLDDLLGAVRMDEDRHGAGFHVGNGNFHLGVAGVSGQLDFDGGGGVAVPGGLDFHRSLDRFAGLLRILDGLATESGLCRGLAVLVGLDGAGGAVSGLGLGNGAAVGIGCGLGSAAVLGGSGLHLGAVLLGLGLNLGTVGLGGGRRIGLAAAGAAATAAAGGRASAGRGSVCVPRRAAGWVRLLRNEMYF